ncbi:MAG: hypothetical protein HY657_06955 [Acidobacteria bacterium]|nr:hypothetical protein [Acidobacteriota bacterium]
MTIELALTVAAPTVLVLGVVLWLHVRQQAAVHALDERIAHLLAGTTLLTDTVEDGLRGVAVEVVRLATVTEGARPRAAGAGSPSHLLSNLMVDSLDHELEQRIAAAAYRGRSVQEIAAREQMSEGEVRMRLELGKSRKEHADHATVR